MIEAVLFDLDGTLLDNDFDRFLRAYLRALSGRLAHLMPPQEFATQLMAATNCMLTDRDPTTTNEQVFRTAFEGLTGRSLDEFIPAIEDFYAQDFGRLQEFTSRRPEAREIVQHVLAAGRQAVVATNALFPFTAIQQRMAWAGVEDLPFALVSSYEHMHFAKPQPEFFLEIARRINVPAARCLMVGDDVAMDSPALEAGMRFYEICAEGEGGPERGTLRQLMQRIDEGYLDS
jgi:FMN phosphatase YigB (HAD superfamily)